MSTLDGVSPGTADTGGSPCSIEKTGNGHTKKSELKCAVHSKAIVRGTSIIPPCKLGCKLALSPGPSQLFSTYSREKREGLEFKITCATYGVERR